MEPCPKKYRGRTGQTLARREPQRWGLAGSTGWRGVAPVLLLTARLAQPACVAGRKEKGASAPVLLRPMTLSQAALDHMAQPSTGWPNPGPDGPTQTNLALGAVPGGLGVISYEAATAQTSPAPGVVPQGRGVISS